MKIGAKSKTRWTQPQFWYHVSRRDLGPRVALEPRRIDNPPEPKRLRICVAPTVAQCLAAIDCYSLKAVVYRTANKVRAYYPYNVCDTVITKERWLLRPIHFRKVLTFQIDLKSCNTARGDKDTLEDQVRDYLGICQRICEEGLHKLNPNITWMPAKMFENFEMRGSCFKAL